jgi:hypothetical protein
MQAFKTVEWCAGAGGGAAGGACSRVSEPDAVDEHSQGVPEQAS